MNHNHRISLLRFSNERTRISNWLVNEL